MAFVPPSVGTSSVWFSRYNNNIQEILQALPDNSSNLILAENVRDAVWTLYHEIQSLTFSIVGQDFTSPGPSTLEVGGIPKGTTYSNADIQTLFEDLLNPVTVPGLIDFSASVTEVQIGSNPMSPVTFNYVVDQGSSPVSVVQIDGPGGSSAGTVTTGDPVIGVNSTTLRPVSDPGVVPVQLNTFTFSVTTVDTVVHILGSVGVELLHKIYVGGENPGTTTSQWVTWASTDSNITGLTAGVLSRDFVFVGDITLSSGQRLVLGVPDVMGSDLPYGGVFVNNMLNSSFTKVRNAVNLTNEVGYVAPYNVWVSDNIFSGSVSVTVKIEI
jgi:hypothetical protein